MKKQQIKLSDLGWNDWFEQRAEREVADAIARVVVVDRGQFLVVNETGPFRAKLAGSYLHRNRSSQQMPCVGDWVRLVKQADDEMGVIHAILERRTSLRRKLVGKVMDYQMIAANVDHVVIVQSCHYDFNLKRLERYLVMVMDGGAEPCILLTKTDLVDPAVAEEQVAQLRAAGITAPIVTLSNVTGDGVKDFRRLLLAGKTYCFIGSSGVGKSTLINKLLGREALDTNSVSENGEGRHTTVSRELIRLKGGALVIDNPGMREFGVLSSEDGIETGFSDISDISSICRFRDCTHTGEPGCAVLEAVRSGNISQEHLDNFQKLKEESKFHQMSYAEKRRKDRNFGKFIKSVKKHLDDE